MKNLYFATYLSILKPHTLWSYWAILSPPFWKLSKIKNQVEGNIHCNVCIRNLSFNVFQGGSPPMVSAKIISREGLLKGTYLASSVLHVEIFWSIWIFSCHSFAHKIGLNSAFTVGTSVENICPPNTQQWNLSWLFSSKHVYAASHVHTIPHMHTVSLKMVEKTVKSDKQSLFHMPAKDVTVLSLSAPTPSLTSGVWVRSPGPCRWSHLLPEPSEQPRLMQRHDCWHLALQLVNSWMNCSQFSGWLCRHMLYHDVCIEGGELRLHSMYECIHIHMCAAVQSKDYASMR